jgi:hypothetical protein
MISPFFEELSGKYSNVIFVKIDVDELDVSACFDSWQTTPTVGLVLFRYGRIAFDAYPLVCTNRAAYENPCPPVSVCPVAPVSVYPVAPPPKAVRR